MIKTIVTDHCPLRIILGILGVRIRLSLPQTSGLRLDRVDFTLLFFPYFNMPSCQITLFMLIDQFPVVNGSTV